MQKSLRFLLPERTIVIDRLQNTYGKKVCFIRFVEAWIERNRESGIVLLNKFIPLPEAYLNQYVFVTVYLETSILSIISEHEGIKDEILRQNFPYTL